MVFRIQPRVHPPFLATCLFQEALWRMDPSEFSVYLTFDDGPVPEITPWVLDLLEREKIQATFFCVGQNVDKHPQLFREVLERGHSVGNHTYHHLQGLKSSDRAYFEDIDKASLLIRSDLFRPPHGFLTQSQYKVIKSKYRVIMWDIVSRDYDRSTSPHRVVRNVRHFVRPGSIITFHDSVKAWPNLRDALPAVIKMLKEKGYHFRAIPSNEELPLILSTHEKVEYLHM